MRVRNLEKYPYIAFSILLTILMINITLKSVHTQNTGNNWVKELPTAISLSIENFISAFAIVFSGTVALQAFINNRFYELHKSFYTKDMLKARQSVDECTFLNNKEKLDEVHSKLGITNSEINEELKIDIENYYQILRFLVYLDEVCIAYRTGVIPKEKFVRTFGSNILEYSEKLSIFIKHRQGKKKGYDYIIEKAGGKDVREYMYNDIKKVALHLKESVNWEKIYR